MARARRCTQGGGGARKLLSLAGSDVDAQMAGEKENV